MGGDPVAPTSGTFAGVPSAAAAPNPFATAPPATSPYEPLLPSTGAGLGSVPATGASAISPEERPAVAVGLKISRLLDMPKTAPEHGQYVVKVISADGGVDELPAVTGVPGVGDSVEDVDMSKSANLSIMTSAVKVTVQVLRGGGWLGGGSLVGEAVIHRFDPRSKTNCAYVLTNPEPGATNCGGIELTVIEKAEPATPAGLVPEQHDVLALLTIDKLIQLPPPAGMLDSNKLLLKIEPVDKLSIAERKRFTKVLGPFNTEEDPQKKKCRMAVVKAYEEYKGVFRADRGGVVRIRIAACYQGSTSLTGDTEIGAVQADVCFGPAVPVQHVALMVGQRPVGGIYLGHQLVQQSKYLEEKKKRAAAGTADPVVTAAAGQPEVAVTVPDHVTGAPGAPSTPNFPTPTPDEAETSQIQALEKKLQDLEKSNSAARRELSSLKAGGKPSAFDELFTELGPPSVDPHASLAPGLGRSFYAATRKDDGQLHLDTLAQAEVLAPIEMIVSRSLPDKNLRFRDCDPNYSVQEDVWALVQNSLHVPVHNQPASKETQAQHRTRPVREECLLA